jgi:hypothetical protein
MCLLNRSWEKEASYSGKYLFQKTYITGKYKTLVLSAENDLKILYPHYSANGKRLVY